MVRKGERVLQVGMGGGMKVKRSYRVSNACLSHSCCASCYNSVLNSQAQVETQPAAVKYKIYRLKRLKGKI